MIVLDRAVFVDTGPSPANVTLVNDGPNTVSYGVSEQAVTDGTITAGSSLILAAPTWLKCATGLRTNVTVQPPLNLGLRQYDKDDAQTGMYAPSGNGHFTVLAAPVASRATFVRFVPSRSMTIASMAFAVTTLGADVACDVGIYSAGLVRLGVSTAAASRLATTGVKNISLTSPVPLAARTPYYAAFSCDAGSTAVLLQAQYLSTFGATLYGATAGLVEVDFTAASHPLPATLSVTGGALNGVFFALRES
jgi:hypothetical protein